jgi:hypothetical protein
MRLASLRIAMPEDDVENSPDLSISPEKVCYIIVKAREFDAKDVVTDPDDASNPTDDGMVSVLEDHRDDPVVQEIAAAIFAMSEDEQVDLVTLAWLGRGDGSPEDWDELRAEAARSHNKRTASYLLGMPPLPDYLQDGLAQRRRWARGHKQPMFVRIAQGMFSWCPGEDSNLHASRR